MNDEKFYKALIILLLFTSVILGAIALGISDDCGANHYRLSYDPETKIAYFYDMEGNKVAPYVSENGKPMEYISINGYYEVTEE